MAPNEQFDNQFLTKYLLGEDLPGEIQDRIEERYSRDDSEFGRLLQVEDDLIEAYLQGKLASHETAAFETHFLTVPRRRKRLEAQRAIASFFRSEAPPPTLLSAIRHWWEFQRLATRVAAAAGVVLAAGGLGVSTMSYLQLRTELRGVQSRLVDSGSTQPAAPAAILMLDPGTVRAAGDRVRLRPNSDWVTLGLRLPPAHPEAATFTASLTVADGEELW